MTPYMSGMISFISRRYLASDRSYYVMVSCVMSDITTTRVHIEEYDEVCKAKKSEILLYNILTKMDL